MGNKHQHETDYAATGASPLRLERTYNSSSAESSGFGVGWRGTYARSIFVTKDAGTGSAQNSLATLSRADGKQYGFKQAGVGNPWVGDADVSGRLILLGTDASGNPTGWRYINERDETETFDASGKLTSIADRTGRTQTLTYSCKTVSATCPVVTPSSVAPVADLLLAVVDHTGRQLSFAYDGNLRVRTLTTPTGTTSYAYSNPTPKANLSSVSYPGPAARTYLYGEAAYVSPTPATGVSYTNALTGLVDENTSRFATWAYDAQGRAVSSEHAVGIDKVVATYNSDSSAAVVDALGTSRIFGFSTTLNTARSSGVSGQPCQGCIPALSYDTSGNVAGKDDFNGNRICRVSDLARNLEMTRVEGLANTQACSAVTGPGDTLPTGSRKTSTQWHPDWRLEAKRAEPGKLTTSIYNGQPDPFNGNAIASCAPSTALLPDGKPIAVLCKQVEQATSDANGSQGFSASLQSGVANRTRSWTYNSFGQVLTETDPLNNTTTYAYYTDTTADHTLGDLQSVTNAKNQVTNYSKYNKHGQLLESTDPNGVVTTNTYDLRQRLLSTSVAGQTTSYEYDAAGQLLKVVQPDASWIGYEYDAAHRQTAIKDNLGNRIEYALDNAGNKTAQSVKDPQGNLARSLARSIDALGRVQQTTGRE